MDDLEFRRMLLADPKCNDPKVLDAITNDPSKMTFYKDLKQLDYNMTQASQITVPDGFAQRLLLRQNMVQYKQQRKAKHLVQLAMAASIAFVAGISFVIWQQSDVDPVLNLSAHAIAHVLHEEDYALTTNDDISLQQVNTKLARFGGKFTAKTGQIYYANFCDFDKVRSLHLVMQGKSGKVSVFIVPHQKPYEINNSTEGKFNSMSRDFSKASLVVVSEQPADSKELLDKLSKSLLFSA